MSRRAFSSIAIRGASISQSFSPVSWFQTVASAVLGGSTTRLWTPISDLVEDFILWAVPKNKVPRSRIRKRLFANIPKPEKNIHECPVCGTPKLPHHLCKTCLASFVKTKIVEIGDEFKGKTIISKNAEFHTYAMQQRIRKARGLNNTAKMAKQRKGQFK